MKLSKNLSLSEVTKSATAKRLRISNEPTKQHLQNLTVLAKEVFQLIRNHFNEPIYISSGYRSRALNKAIGGSKSSHHCKGMALDLDQDYRNTNVTNEQIFNYIKDNLEFTQLINENNYSWVHISYDAKDLKKEMLELKNGKYIKL